MRRSAMRRSDRPYPSTPRSRRHTGRSHARGSSPFPRRRHRLRAVLAVILGSVLLSGAIPAHANPDAPTRNATPGPLRPGTAEPAPEGTIELRLLAIGDLMGTLSPPTGDFSTIRQSDGTSIPAGGAAYLASTIAQLREQSPHSLLYSVGDNMGVTQAADIAANGRPALEVLSRLQLDATLLGNHDLDWMYRTAACPDPNACTFPVTLPDAAYPVLAANADTTAGAPATLPFSITRVDSVPVGVIGVTNANLGDMIDDRAAFGLRFGDELEAIDRSARTLDFLGVKSIILLLHEGETTGTDGPNACNMADGRARRIAERASPKVDVIFSAHGGASSNCVIPDPTGAGRPVIKPAGQGRMVSVADVVIDRTDGDILRSRTTAYNQVVNRSIAPDAEVQGIIDAAEASASQHLDQRVTTLTADLGRTRDPAGGTPAANLIADAFLAADPRGARPGDGDGGEGGAGQNPPVAGSLGLVPTGSVQGSVAAGEVKVRDLYPLQPYRNPLVGATMEGRQLRELLEDQFGDNAHRELWRRLAASANVTYSIDLGAPPGSRVADVTINGRPLAPTARYRVITTEFVAWHSTAYAAGSLGENQQMQTTDLEALIAYLRLHSPFTPPGPGRVQLR